MQLWNPIEENLSYSDCKAENPEKCNLCFFFYFDLPAQ